MAPRKLVGAISDKYIGARPAEQIQLYILYSLYIIVNKFKTYQLLHTQYIYSRNSDIQRRNLTRVESVVDANEKTTRNDHLPGPRHLTESKQDCSNKHEDVVQQQASFTSKPDQCQIN